MTREDIEKLNAVEPYCFESDREEQWYNIGLKNGLEIADEHPKSPWISVEDDLPCNHSELINNNFKSLQTKNVIVVLENNYIDDGYMFKTGTEWKWIYDESPKYWCPYPNLPK